MGIIGLKVKWCKKGDWNTQTEGTELSNWQLQTQLSSDYCGTNPSGCFIEKPLECPPQTFVTQFDAGIETN